MQSYLRFLIFYPFQSFLFFANIQIFQLAESYQFSFFKLGGNELQDVTAYGLRSDILSPETMPQATVELALTKNRKLLLACMLPPVLY